MKLAAILILILLSVSVSAGKINYTIYGECTDSMFPTITCHNKVIVNTVTKADKLEIGRIYSFKPDKRDYPVANLEWAMHRLARIDGDMCIFKPDNYEYYDPPIKCNRINHVVVDII